MIGLTLHRTKTTHLPHELSFVSKLGAQTHEKRNGVTYPADSLPMLLSAVGIRNLVILIVRSDDIQKDSTTFEDLDLATTFILIGKCWNATIGVDLEEPRLFLLVLTEV